MCLWRGRHNVPVRFEVRDTEIQASLVLETASNLARHPRVHQTPICKMSGSQKARDAVQGSLERARHALLTCGVWLCLAKLES